MVLHGGWVVERRLVEPSVEPSVEVELKEPSREPLEGVAAAEYPQTQGRQQWDVQQHHRQWHS